MSINDLGMFNAWPPRRNIYSFLLDEFIKNVKSDAVSFISDTMDILLRE